MIELVAPGKMSFTITVPAVVPPDFHSSKPWAAAPSLAKKNNVPFTLTMSTGVEEPGPEMMSATSDVPAVVPSDRQSSMPLEGSWPAKNKVPLTFTKLKKSGGLIDAVEPG